MNQQSIKTSNAKYVKHVKQTKKTLKDYHKKASYQSTAYMNQQSINTANAKYVKHAKKISNILQSIYTNQINLNSEKQI